MALRHRGGRLPAAPPGGVAGGGGGRGRRQRAGQAARLRRPSRAPRRPGGGAQGLRARSVGAVQASPRGDLRRVAPDDASGEGGPRKAQGGFRAVVKKKFTTETRRRHGDCTEESNEVVFCETAFQSVLRAPSVSSPCLGGE